MSEALTLGLSLSSSLQDSGEGTSQYKQMDPHFYKVCKAEGCEWQQCNHGHSPSSCLLSVLGGIGVAKGFSVSVTAV